METADFDYLLPADRVATAPAEVRDEARLLVMDRIGGPRKHLRFRDVLEHIPPRSVLALNDTRVLAARLDGRKSTGGAVEFLLTRRAAILPSPPGRFEERWEALGRNLGGGAAVAEPIAVGAGVEVLVLDRGEAGRVQIAIRGEGASLLDVLDRIGRIPLPPYIEAARRRMSAAGPTPTVDDRHRYQTVFAAEPGAVAAPTAGLHFTPELLDAARAMGHEVVFVTLHVGPGTFRPVEVEDPHGHRMDREWYRIPEETAAAIARARAEGRHVAAVGTTVVRTLEASARDHGGAVIAGEGDTDLYLLPGARFQVVTDLITNFHLPRSTLLMLVAAFAGREAVLEAYGDAIARGYRFYSYGDAMLIRGEST